jgi:hypothetical protein
VYGTLRADPMRTVASLSLRDTPSPHRRQCAQHVAFNRKPLGTAAISECAAALTSSHHATAAALPTAGSEVVGRTTRSDFA